MTTNVGGMVQQLRITSVLFSELFRLHQYKGPDVQIFKMAARGGLRLGQALLRRAAFRPQTLIGIRKGNFLMTYHTIGLILFMAYARIS